MRSIQDQYPLVKDTKIMLGLVWPDRHIAFPDFLDENTRKWWIEEFIRFWKQVPFDGIWIDMNEPANFGTNEAKPWYFDNPDHPNISTLYCPLEGPDSSWDMPPYKTHNDAILATKTLCMLALQANDTQRFYNVKGLYGLHEAEVTLAAQYAATNRRGAVVSRSTFASAGRYAGHWLGDNSANWEDLQTSVIGAQEFNMFGIPYIGSDICGFFGDATEELCLRWQQMGAFHKFMRNHNAKGQAPQDPAKWPSVAEAAKKATLFRYYYLPYLYSVFFAVSMNGGTVVRPVFFEFSMDKETHNLGHQFLWGSSMMVAPVLHKGATTVDAYLPDDVWYSLYDYKYAHLIPPGYSTFPAPWTSLIPVFVRGGYGSADGFLFWDDGETIIHSFASHNYFEWSFKFYCDTQHATLFIRTDRHAEDLKIPTLDTLEIFNYKYKPNLDSFTLNGAKITIKHSITPTDRQSCTFKISKRRMIDISTAHTYTLSWTHTTA
ncbi:glycosyl hydrolase, family 31 [Ancylostoma duodenale]|uniref:Glycosyl hydrolase, family 31 n=1 Tax=Ancylostoma duodenale TaxID=51022 RepID=A0A0C2DAF2_9BILA|nr:glycosyl hydrolase, family 31 [Ancylostoma duodenale]